MNETHPKWDLWKLPTLLLWLIFFMVGLAPVYVFNALRDYAGVLTQNALVNSPHMLTIALAGYMTIFVFNRCLAAGASAQEAQEKAIQVGIFAWVAFLPLDFFDVILAYANPLVRNRTIIYFAAAMKLTAWWLLLVMILRYYLLTKGSALFPNIVSPASSTKQEETLPENTLNKSHATADNSEENPPSDFIPDIPKIPETPPSWSSTPSEHPNKRGTS